MLYFKSRTGLIRREVLIPISVLFLLAAGLLIIFIHHHMDTKSNKYNALIIKYARQYSVDPNLIKAVIWRESGFDARTEGSKGEIGLMQIIPSASVRDWAIYNKRPVPPNGLLFSPDINIDVGTWYLARCTNHWIKYKNRTALVLAEYNAGYTNAKKWAPNDLRDEVIDRITFSSTKDYVIDILDQYEEYKSSKASLNIEANR